jgi:CRP/FNR family transcriptional regulator, cyclic AMP receptor protein
MNNFNDSLKKILNFAFSDKSNSFFNSKDFLKDFSSDDINILNLKESKIFINRNNELDYIFILVNGRTYVENYTFDGRRIIADTHTKPQIFGLIEAINNNDFYKGTVITLSKSLLVKVSKEKFLETLYTDINIASNVIKYLADFSTHSIKVFEYKTAISTYENLILYLYNKVLGKNLPNRIEDKKSFIADSLQINKRTLYRYLNKLTEEGIISREGQSIIVSDSNFTKIEKLFNSINDL